MNEPILGLLNKEDENENETAQKTTVALFMELLPYNVKDVSMKGLLNNTLKVLIAVETAFGMSRIQPNTRNWDACIHVTKDVERGNL